MAKQPRVTGFFDMKSARGQAVTRRKWLAGEVAIIRQERARRLAAGETGVCLCEVFDPIKDTGFTGRVGQVEFQQGGDRNDL